MADVAEGSCLGSFACAGTGREDPGGNVVTPEISIDANSWYVVPPYGFGCVASICIMHSQSLLTFFLHFYPCLFPALVMVRAISLQVQASVLGLGEYLSF